MRTVRAFSAALALFAASAASAQPAAVPVAAPALSEAAASVKADVTYLASDELKGRRAGTPEADRAAAWLAGRFEKLGLAPAGVNGSWYQTFDFIDGVDLGSKNRLETAEGGSRKAWTVGVDFRPLAFSAAGALEGEVVFAGYGISAKDPAYDDYEGLDVKDKLVLVLRYGPDGDDEKSLFSTYAALRFKAAVAREKGAKGLLVVAGPLTKDVADDLIALRTDAAFSDAGLVAVSIRRPVAEALLAGSGRSLEAAQKAIDAAKKPASFAATAAHVALNVDVTPRRAKTSNVLGLLEGSDPAKKAEIVIVGAHYDHLGLGGSTSLASASGPQIHHGADDNASGVAAMLETARDLAGRRKDLARSILFIGFGAEELGTLGSLHFTKNPTVPWASVVAMFNMDMVGRLRNDKLDVQGVGTSPAWKPLVESSNADAKLKLSLLEGGFGPSDHSPFYAAKRPVLFAFTGAHGDYHKPSDTADRIDAEGIVRVVRFLEPIEVSVASAPERIAFTEVKGGAAPSAGSRSFRVWVGSIPDFSEEGQGVKLSGVTGGSPAEKAGMMAGDTIVKFGGKELRNLYDYTYALQGRKPGEKVDVVVKRVVDGKTVEKTLEVTLGSRPDATK
jgi:hypothetical protein